MKLNRKVALATLATLVAGGEGFRQTSYRDVGGVLTQYFGHRINGTEKGKTPEQIFKGDLETALSCVERNITIPLNEAQEAAVADVAYNMGCSGFLKTTFYKKLSQGIFSEADLLALNTAKGVPYNGLTKRRQKEACLFKTSNPENCLKD